MSKRRILWVGPSTDPWSPWSLSGISREICLELRRRDRLFGAISPDQISERNLLGEAPLHALESRIADKAGLGRALRDRWHSEDQGAIGRVLSRAPEGTVVIYSVVAPRLADSVRHERFRWMDLSVRDAVQADAFGFGGMTDQQVDAFVLRERLMLAGCEGVVALSTHAANSIARDLGYPRSKITPIGAGPAVWPESLPPSDASRFAKARVLFVGRDWQRKGGDHVWQAVQILRKRIPHATLTVVGPKTPPIEPTPGFEFIRPLDKSAPADRAKLHEIYNSSSVLCMASSAEPWGLVYVEAAAFGMPVVAVDSWALRDIVEDGKTGALAHEASSEALAEGLHSVLADPETSRRMGDAGRERVRTVLSWDAVVDRLLSRVLPEALGDTVAIPMQPEA